MRKVSATEARIHFGELMRRAVTDQEPVIVERSGEPHVVILSVEQYERLRVAQEAQIDWQERVDEARRRAAGDLGDRALPPAEDVIREMREERNGELLDLR